MVQHLEKTLERWRLQEVLRLELLNCFVARFNQTIVFWPTSNAIHTGQMVSGQTELPRHAPWPRPAGRRPSRGLHGTVRSTSTPRPGQTISYPSRLANKSFTKSLTLSLCVIFEFCFCPSIVHTTSTLLGLFALTFIPIFTVCLNILQENNVERVREINRHYYRLRVERNAILWAASDGIPCPKYSRRCIKNQSFRVYPACSC